MTLPLGVWKQVKHSDAGLEQQKNLYFIRLLAFGEARQGGMIGRFTPLRPRYDRSQKIPQCFFQY